MCYQSLINSLWVTPFKMKSSLIIILIVFQIALSEKININQITENELSSLPLSYEQQIALIEYLDSRGYLITIYDLLEIPEFSSTDINNLKPIIVVD